MRGLDAGGVANLLVESRKQTRSCMNASSIGVSGIQSDGLQVPG